MQTAALLRHLAETALLAGRFRLFPEAREILAELEARLPSHPTPLLARVLIHLYHGKTLAADYELRTRVLTQHPHLPEAVELLELCREIRGAPEEKAELGALYPEL